MAAIVIIGGGLSGALTALHLLRLSPVPLTVYLVDRQARVGPGLAYATRRSCHRLNVRAGALSIFAEEPEHFVRWLTEHGGSGDPGEFALRETFGYYIEDQVRQYTQRRGVSELRIVRDEAVGCALHGDGAIVELSSGERIAARQVVLAIGNFPPARLACAEQLQNDVRYIADPWTPGAMERMAKCSRLILVGSGLTMVDVVLGLEELGFTGKTTALSRHGLLPAVHVPPGSYPTFYDEMLHEPTAAAMVRTVRRHIELAAEQAKPPQVVIDSLRPHIQGLWLALPQPERRRFLRHIRHYWDTIRHRMAPQCGRAIAEFVRLGRLEIVAGTIAGLVPHDDTISVEYRRRGEEHCQSAEVEGIINCTGPAQDYSRIEHPLVVDLVRQGALQCDSLHLGVHAEPNGRLIDARGAASDVLYTIGPPLRGVLWETTAVGEIRQQASALATLLLEVQKSELAEEGIG